MLACWFVSKNVQKKRRNRIEIDNQKADIISIIDEAVSSGSNIKSKPRLSQDIPQLGLPKWGKWFMGFAWLPFIVTIITIIITVSLNHNNNSPLTSKTSTLPTTTTTTATAPISSTSTATTSATTSTTQARATSSMPTATITSYTLITSVNSAGGGTVSPSGGSYSRGISVTLTATQANGWTFGGWSGSTDIANTTANPTTITMNNNETVTANFTQNIYTLTTSVNPAGEGTVNPSGGSYPSGTSVILTAKAATGWAFSSWSGSTDIANTTANPTTITMNNNETVTANFTQNIYTLTTSVNPAGEGTVNPSGGSYPSGTSVILTAKAATGWTFSSWSGSPDIANTTANPTTITMNGNETVTATFIPGVEIQSVALPSNAKTSSGIILTTYPTTFRLVNNESVDVTVTWQVHFFANGNPFSNYSNTVTVPQNGYIDVTNRYYYPIAGTWNVTYTISINNSQVDTWSGTMIILQGY